MSLRGGLELPDGWAEASIGDLFTVVGGGTPSTANRCFWDGSVPWVTSADISEDHSVTPRRSVTPDAIASSAANQVPAGSIIIATRVGLGKVGLATTDLSFSQDCHALLPADGHLEARFVTFQVSTAAAAFRHISRGTTINGITKRQLLETRFRIPPIKEQHRIVEEIEKQFSRLDAAVTNLKRVQANLKRYRASVLQAACEGRLVPTQAELARTEGRDYEPAGELLQRVLIERRKKWEENELAKMREKGKEPKDDKWKARYRESVVPDTGELPELPEGWCWATVDQLAAFEPDSITDGPFGSNLKTSHYTNGGPRVIRLKNIGDGVFNDEKAHISESHYQSLLRHKVEAGDVVIAGMSARPPRSCVIPASVGSAIVKADCIRFKPGPSVALAAYVNGALNSESVRQRLASIVHGVGRPRLNLSEIKAISLPLPPLIEQNRIVAEAERRLSVIDQMEAAAEMNLKRAERLRQAILKRAFEGKLVRQDPNDEPAGVLLERIRERRMSRRQATILESAENL